MLQIYVIRANDLPKMDTFGKSDPYVNVYGSDYKDKFKCGQTSTIKQNLNPVWDQNCTTPFYLPFVACKSIKFEIFDHDKVGTDEKIGSAKFDFLFNELSVEKTLYVKPKRQTKHHPTITVKVLPPSQPFPQQMFQPMLYYLYFYLEFNPPQGGRCANLQLFEFSNNPKAPFQHIAYGNKNDGIKMDSIPSHPGITGFTNCIRVNLAKKLHSFFVPFINYQNYSGKVSICVAASTRPNKVRNAKGKKSFDSSQLNVVFLNKFDVSLSPSQSPETIFPGMLLIFSNRQLNFTTTQIFDRKNEKSVLSIARKYATMFIPNVRFDSRFAVSTGRPISFFSIGEFHGMAPPKQISLALGWDTTTDLDASVITFTPDGKFDNGVSFKNLVWYDGALRHHGDDLTGRGGGDDEIIDILLDRLPQNLQCVAITINSYSGLTFSSVKGGFLRLFDPQTKREWLYLPLTKQKDKTALVFAFLWRYNNSWILIPVMKYYFAQVTEQLIKPIQELMTNGKYIPKMLGRIID